MTPRFLIITTLSALALVALAATSLAAVLSSTAGGRRLLGRWLGARTAGVLGAAWGIALIATLGSLYFSEGLGLEPCKLCWFQRIAMYPLVVVLGVALLRRDASVWKTALPLAVIGATVSAYHVAVQFLPEIEVTQCSASAPCSLRYFQTFGFVTIPVMAGSAFLLIAAAMVAQARLGAEGADTAP